MADPHVLKARSTAHLKHSEVCACGKRVYGNGRKSHQRNCEAYLQRHGYPLSAWTVESIRLELRDSRPRISLPGGGSRPVVAPDLLAAIRHHVGLQVLARRQDGNKSPLQSPELQSMVWVAYRRTLASVVGDESD